MPQGDGDVALLLELVQRGGPEDARMADAHRTVVLAREKSLLTEACAHLRDAGDGEVRLTGFQEAWQGATKELEIDPDKGRNFGETLCQRRQDGDLREVRG